MHRTIPALPAAVVVIGLAMFSPTGRQKELGKRRLISHRAPFQQTCTQTTSCDPRSTAGPGQILLTQIRQEAYYLASNNTVFENSGKPLLK